MKSIKQMITPYNVILIIAGVIILLLVGYNILLLINGNNDAFFKASLAFVFPLVALSVSPS